MAATNDYDIFAIDNDFSSSNLLFNLKTTFAKNYYSVITDQEDMQFEAEIRLAQKTFSSEETHNIYSDIAIRPLKKAYIIPILYQKVIFIHKKDKDLSNWSKISPELTL